MCDLSQIIGFVRLIDQVVKTNLCIVVYLYTINLTVMSGKIYLFQIMSFFFFFAECLKLCHFTIYVLSASFLTIIPFIVYYSIFFSILLIYHFYSLMKELEVLLMATHLFKVWSVVEKKPAKCLLNILNFMPKYSLKNIFQINAILESKC
jgi:hypothetical protein